MSPSLAFVTFPALTAFIVSVASTAGMTGAARAAPAPSNLPASEAPFAVPRVLLAWVGTGSASVHSNGAWRRVPEHDYEFSVIQRRHAGHWESVKAQHRRHPGYDGSAGPREQVHYFRVDLTAQAAADELGFGLRSSFGDGQGRIDREFRNGRMEFEAKGVSLFAPYNRYRITQQYRYEQGQLVEVVELFKKKGELETPFMRFEERATLLAPQRFAAAPTGDDSGPAPGR